MSTQALGHVFSVCYMLISFDSRYWATMKLLQRDWLLTQRTVSHFFAWDSFFQQTRSWIQLNESLEAISIGRCVRVVHALFHKINLHWEWGIIHWQSLPLNGPVDSVTHFMLGAYFNLMISCIVTYSRNVFSLALGQYSMDLD